MRVARNARCGFRSSPARSNSNRNSRFRGFELSGGNQAIKQFSIRNKTRFFAPVEAERLFRQFGPCLHS